MSREIKFRAWDKDEQKMLNPPVELKQLLRQVTRPDDNSVGGDAIRRHDLDWMQYIGLKDKNGVEVYEGDIVRIDEDLAGAFNVAPIGPVTYLRGQFYANRNCENLAGFSALADLNGEMVRCIVIGNIHENPELLEAQR